MTREDDGVSGAQQAFGVVLCSLGLVMVLGALVLAVLTAALFAERGGSALMPIAQTALILIVAAGLLRAGLRFLDPSRFSREGSAAHAITELSSSMDAPDERPPEADVFETFDDAELHEAYESIDSERYPQRWRALKWVICSRRREG